MREKESEYLIEDKNVSRFFLLEDKKVENFVFHLPVHWWSRYYEYAWAADFINANDVTLDAACGICHPLKFYMSDCNCEVYACDLDERILSQEHIKKEINLEYNIPANSVPDRYFNKIRYKQSSIASLPYNDKMFDKIFCISVLEHLELEDIERSLKEFKRTLKDEGLIILTFDFPRIDLEHFNSLLRKNDLEYVSVVDYELSPSAIYYPEKSLYCFRAVIQKKKNNNAHEISGEHFDYKSYWENRYSNGGLSGLGSYNELANFKSEIINKFIELNPVESVIEFGCGDGNNLSLMNYKRYLGLDVAKSSIDLCSSIFKNDSSKSFIQYDPLSFFNNGFLKSDLVICLDVLYHIIPENDFLKTLSDIFSCSSKYVIIYTSIKAFLNEPYQLGSHVRHRDILSYLKNYPEFVIEDIIEQRYKNQSSADFIILKRKTLQKKDKEWSNSNRQNIGFISIWFERGQSYVTKAIRDALAEQHNTFIFARMGFVNGTTKIETKGNWNVPNLTVYEKYDIPHPVFLDWIRKNKLDTVVFNEEYDWSLVELCKKERINTVTYLDYLKEDWIPKMYLYDTVICSTRRSYDLVKNHCNASFVGWGIDTFLFSVPENEKKEFTYFHNAGWFGTNFRKMTPAAVIAFDAVSKILPEVSLLIHSQVGIENLPVPIQDIIRTNPKIKFIADTIPAPGLYHKGKILLFPTKMEGLGLPLLEALSCGLPVIATDDAPMNEFITNGFNGLLVKVAQHEQREDNIIFKESIIDVNDLVQKMFELAKDENLLNKLSGNAREYALKELSYSKFSSKIQALEIFNKGYHRSV